MSGGGELIDQGVHLIDLARWFLGDFTDVEGFAAHLLLGHAGRRQRASCCCGRPSGQIAFLHASCTEWKNLFSLEIYGRDGKLADRRPRRQLRRRAADLLPDAARDGAAGDDDLGISRWPIDSWALEFASSSRTSGSGAQPAAGLRRRARGARRRRSRSTASGSPADDHHAESASDHARRRRHRSAVVLPRARRLPDRRRDRQVRLRHGDAAVHAGHLSQVLEARARRRASTRSSIRSSARRSGMLGFKTPQIEITTLADIPAGTGLGSSGSFTTALLKALYAHRRRLLHPQRAGRAGLRDRDRSARRADRQAGPVHRRVRRRHLLHVPPGRARSRPSR